MYICLYACDAMQSQKNKHLVINDNDGYVLKILSLLQEKSQQQGQPSTRGNDYKIKLDK